MGIRMGSSHFMNNYNVALNNAYQKQAKLFEQADGSSLHRASDNPMNYSKLLRYNVSDTENEQYRANLKTASSWMKNSDDVMIHMTEIMQTMKEKSVQAANSDNAEDDYAAIYKEMFAGMQEMTSALNTQVGDRYLFAGQKDLTQPFTLSEEKYDRGIPKTLDSAQSAFFKNAVGDYNTELFQLLELEKDGETFYLDAESGDIFTKEFVDKGYKEAIALGYKNVDAAKEALDKVNAAAGLNDAQTAYDNAVAAQAALPSTATADEVAAAKEAVDNAKAALDKAKESADTLTTADKEVAAVLKNGLDGTTSDFAVSDYFTNQGLLKDAENKSSITVDGNTYTFATIRQNIITYNGDENLISMVKLNGPTDPGADTVNSTGARMFGRDIFDNAASGNEPSGTAMLNELCCICEKVNTCDVHWMSSDGVGIADVAHATLVVEETRIGARQQLYQSVERMLENEGDNITEDITNVSGTDIAQLATKLMQMTTLYNLSLSMGGRILPQSLADYL